MKSYRGRITYEEAGYSAVIHLNVGYEMTGSRLLIEGFPLTRRWAVDLVAGVLPPSKARPGSHHIGPLESILYRAYRLFKEPQEQFTQRVRAAFRILEDGFDSDPAAMARVFSATVDKLGPLQQTEHNLCEDAWGVHKDDPDRRFRSLLDLYQMTYEQYYPTLAALLVVGGRLADGDLAAEHAVGIDGRVKLNVIAELEAGKSVGGRAFTNGLDNHLRNSTAHHHFNIQSANGIRMWDLNPRSGGYSWGPHTFTYGHLRGMVCSLSVTSLVLLAAVILFDVGYGRTMVARGWMAPTLRSRRSDVLKSELEDMAQVHGLTLVEVDQDGLILQIRLRVLGVEMSDQVSEIIEGGGRVARRYTQDIETHRAPAWMQVYGFLQTTYDLHGYYNTVTLTLDGPDGQKLGELHAPRDVREAMVTTTTAASDLRSRMAVDTLSNEDIPVVINGIPEPIS